jgi:hypothetical protein
VIEFLDYETPIYILDEPLKPPPTPTNPSSSHTSRASLSPTRSRKRKASPPPTSTSTAVTPSPSHSSISYQILDYTSIPTPSSTSPVTDPLSDPYYIIPHRRAERKEKQLRNIEKSRAMHEKLQLERLLDGLQGPDWLKVMGITGVTDGERKGWEGKRDWFIGEVEALVDKFRVWKEEEKRVRDLKDRERGNKEEESGSGDGESEDEVEDKESLTVRAKQKTPVPRRPPRPHGFLLPFIPPEPTTPFTSFYAKTPHLRAAALGKNRTGRNLTAFGVPLPEPEEREFEVPEDFVDPQFLRDNARQRRRRLRESRGEGK